MARQAAQTDRNFDDLALRYRRNVYGTLKGEIRLAVLHRDLAEYVPLAPYRAGAEPVRVLDAGGGQGQFSLALARAGHQVVLCDISSRMLALAEDAWREAGLLHRLTLVQCPLQELVRHLPEGGRHFDLVLCHAVMEWLARPQELLPALMAHLAPGAWLSLTYYNQHAMVYKNLLRTNYRKVLDRDYGGFRGSLTPINPLLPETVDGWLAQLPLEVVCRSGIRVFHDMILDPAQRRQQAETVLQLELELSRQDPYRSLGRYLHVLARGCPG